MDVIKENIVKFIDTMIVDNYSKAHKYLGILVQEKVKEKIKKAKNLKPFGKKEDEKKSKNKSKKKSKLPDFLKKMNEKGSKAKK